MTNEDKKLAIDIVRLWNSKEANITVKVVADRLGIDVDTVTRLKTALKNKGAKIKDRRGRQADPDLADLVAELNAEFAID